MKSWLTTPLEWSAFRAFIALPATWVAGLLLLLNSLFFLLALLSPLLPFAALALLCTGSVGAAFAVAWDDLSRKSSGRRAPTSLRIFAITALSLWLLVDLVRYPFFKKSDLSDVYPWRLVPRGFPTPVAALIPPIEWITLITTAWLLIELLLPINTSPEPRVPPLARGWAVLLLLVGFVGTPMAISQYQFYKFINSPESVEFRTFGPGTIGEALCTKKDVPSAQDRVGRLGAAVKDDELLRLAQGCSGSLTWANTDYDIGINARLIGLMARLLATHRPGATAHGYCGQEEEEFLERLYITFVPEYLTSAKEGGLPMDCLKTLHKYSWSQGQQIDHEDGIPLWWSALIKRNVQIRGQTTDIDLEFWQKRIETLKRLGIDVRQKSRQGRDVLADIDITEEPTSPLIGLLVDDGLDIDAPSEIDGIPLRIRSMYWRHGTRTDEPEVLRLSERIGDPPTAQIARRLRRFAQETNGWNDDQQTLLWKWISTQVGPKAITGVLYADSTQRPKLAALLQELRSERSKSQE